MALSKVALLCLESSPFLRNDILNLWEDDEDDGVNRKRRKIKPVDLKASSIQTNPNNEERNARILEFNNNMYEEFRNNPDQFYEHTRMSVKTFDYILANIRKHLKSVSTSEKAVQNKTKLFLTLRYLASGTSFKSLSLTFGLGRGTVAKIIYQTLKAIWRVFHEITFPQLTQSDILKMSEDFLQKYQFPGCIGSISRMQICVKYPANSSSDIKFQTLELQATADADYKFVSIEVGDEEGEPQVDEDDFDSTALGRLVNKHQVLRLPAQPLPDVAVCLPPVLAGDAFCPLKVYLMRPYLSIEGKMTQDKRIFNKRLSRARTIDRAFMVLTKKWKIFNKPIERNKKHAEWIIKTACVLHNIVRLNDGDQDKDFIDSLEMKRSHKIEKKLRPIFSSETGFEWNTRHMLKAYFFSDESFSEEDLKKKPK